MSDAAVHGRRSRAKGQDAAIRSEALERLKALRSSGGRRSAAGVGFQIKMEEPIYDTVEEDDYAALVARRREDGGGFIVDDDGLGYAEDGREEDWSNPSFTHSDEESSEGQEEKQRKKKAAKKETAVKKVPSSSLSAAASLMGKQRLSSMFTSSVFKKNDRGKGPPLSSDSLIDDVITEFAPDETDREKRRRRSATGPRNSALPPIVPIKSEMQLFPVEIGLPEAASSADFKAQVQDNGSENYRQDATIKKEDACIHSVVEEAGTAKFDAGKASISEDAEAEAIPNEKGFSLNAKIKNEEKKSTVSATAGWKAV